MVRRAGRRVAVAAAVVLAGAIMSAQGRGVQNWNTTSADAQRTGWLRSEARISAAAFRATGPGAFQLLWKVTPQNQPKELNTLTQPLILGNLISHKGFKALAFVGGSSDVVYAYDYDLAKVYWSQRLSTAATMARSTIACPGGLTAITRNIPLAQSAVGSSSTSQSRGAGPGRGSSTPPAAPPAVSGGRGPAPQSSINPANLPITNAVWAISSGGMVHALNPHIGTDLRAPARLVPSSAKVTGSVLVNNVLYASTTDGCGGATNGVWALDVSGEGPSPAAKMWTSGGATIAGNTGPTIGLNDVIYVATGSGAGQYANAVVALDARTLQVRNWFAGESPFTTSPVAFNIDGRDLVAAAARDGRLYVLDGETPGGADHRSPLARSAVYSTSTDSTPGAVTTWQDPAGVRWLLVASVGPVAPVSDAAKFAVSNGEVKNGTIAAFRVRAADQGKSLTLEPAWTSRDLVSPVTPIVLNDVVFAISSGAFRTTDAQMSVAQRLQRSTPAVLYALDAITGKELWSSGRAIVSSVQGIGPSGQDGQVYVVAADGTLYAFGIPLEH
ncbi:MAG TPA: PQQ-binding-like beta-propeller repeat protein [Vicinamibacterales bacterium]|nr:PQQ-binding-like beta-propeller repeat protein [Vicinamibacterales bacterium]